MLSFLSLFPRHLNPGNKGRLLVLHTSEMYEQSVESPPEGYESPLGGVKQLWTSESRILLFYL